MNILPGKRQGEDYLGGASKLAHLDASDEEDEFQLFPGIKMETFKTDAKEAANEPVEGEEKAEAPPVQAQELNVNSETADTAEEEIAFQTKTAIPIPGTSIVLETEEDIAKWIQERRKNWPTNRRVAEKQQQQQQQIHSEPKQPEKPRICRFFAQSGKCRHGQNCKLIHERQERPINRQRVLRNYKIGEIHGIPVQVPKRYAPSTNTGKSLHNLLLENEIIRDENVEILRVIEKLVNSGIVKRDWKALSQKLRLN